MEASYLQCPHCLGAGIVPSIQTASVILFRHLQEKLLAKSAQKIIMTVPTDVAIYLLNHKKAELAEMESEFETEIVIVGDDSLMNIDQYSIHRVSPEQNKTDAILNAHSPSSDFKKKNARKVEAKKIIMNAKRYHNNSNNKNNKNSGNGKNVKNNKPKKQKTLWEKIVG